MWCLVPLSSSENILLGKCPLTPPLSPPSPPLSSRPGAACPRPTPPQAFAPTRSGARAASSLLRDTVFAQIAGKQKELKELGAAHSEKKLGDVTVSQVSAGVSLATTAPLLSFD